MRYNPPKNETSEYSEENDSEENNIENDPVYWEGRPRYVSDQTAFIRWSTELEQVHNIIDNDFLKRNSHRVIDINKILPLSFIDNPKSIKLFRLRRMNMGLARDAGLIDLADETVLDNLADYQTTRGIRGNYQKALITQRREWQDKTDPENKKSGIIGRMIKGRGDEQREMNMQEVY